jgi:glycerol-3-phosphate dehydrogenase
MSSQPERLSSPPCKTQEFDVLVLRGQATGSGCVVTRNLKTALVERNDFSSGTSSRSTKLSHGRVYYLQKAIITLDYEQYMMVKDALHERSNLLDIAAHRPTTHYVPCLQMVAAAILLS